MFADQLDDEKFAEHCKKFFKGKMKTIPDLILDIRWYYKRAIDRPLSWMEAIGSAMSTRLE